MKVTNEKESIIDCGLGLIEVFHDIIVPILIVCLIEVIFNGAVIINYIKKQLIQIYKNRMVLKDE